jgi:hypothetical protein
LINEAVVQSVRRLPLPVDHDQHWAVWLHEWAVYIRNAFVSDPGLLKQYIDGGIGVEVMASNIDAALALCIRQGFSASEALYAYDLVSECALGAAVSQIREDTAREEGRPFGRELRRILARGDLSLPHLGMLTGDADFEPSARFHTQVTTVLTGIAVRRGEAADEVIARLAALRNAAEQA